MQIQPSFGGVAPTTNFKLNQDARVGTKGTRAYRVSILVSLRDFEDSSCSKAEDFNVEVHRKLADVLCREGSHA